MIENNEHSEADVSGFVGSKLGIEARKALARRVCLLPFHLDREPKVAKVNKKVCPTAADLLNLAQDRARPVVPGKPTLRFAPGSMIRPPRMVPRPATE